MCGVWAFGCQRLQHWGGLRCQANWRHGLLELGIRKNWHRFVFGFSNLSRIPHALEDTFSWDLLLERKLRLQGFENAGKARDERKPSLQCAIDEPSKKITAAGSFVFNHCRLNSTYICRRDGLRLKTSLSRQP